MGKRQTQDDITTSQPNVKPGGIIAVRVIGYPTITSNGATVRLRYRKSEALLYYLATEGRPVSRSHITQLLWPDLDARAGARNLRGVLTDLRSILGPRLQADTTTGSITLLQVRCDRHQLQPSHEAAHADPITNDDIRLLVGNEALLEGFDLSDAEGFEAWRSESDARFQHERHATRIALIDVALRNDQTDLAIALLEACSRHEPWNEAIAQRLAMLHLQWTSPTRAVSVLDDVTRTLRSELGEHPHASTRTLRAKALDRIADTRHDAPTLQGRHREIAALRQALLDATAPIVTLRAAPGTGATRALREAQAAARLQTDLPILWIYARPDEDAATLAARIDDAGTHPTPRDDAPRDDAGPSGPHDTVGGKRIILDGAAGHPHLPDIARTLSARGDVTLVLLHAWQPLNLHGEVVIDMRGLTTPAITTRRPVEALTSPAARLFAESYRAQRTDDADVTQHPNFPAWVRATEGHPTTILAMARHLATIGIDAATPHDDMHAGPVTTTPTIETFLATLDADQARVAMALALHRHGATADTLARTMREDVTTITPRLDELVTRGVAYRTGETRSRYRTESGLAPTLRQRARREPEANAWLHHEASGWLERLEPLAAPELGSRERELTTRAIDLLDDIDASIAFLQHDDPHGAIRLATLSATLHRTTSRPDKVIRTLAPLLNAHAADLGPRHRIEARNALAMAHAFIHQYEEARTLQEAALAESDTRQIAYLRAQSRLNLGYVLALHGDLDGAATTFLEARDIAREADLTWLLGGSLINLGHVLKDQNAHHDAIAAYEQGIDAMHRCGDGLSETAGSIGLVSALAATGDTAALATTIHALNVKLGRLPTNTARVLMPSLERNLDALAHTGLAAAFEHLERVARQHGLTRT